jgi:hypothetical protein
MGRKVKPPLLNRRNAMRAVRQRIAFPASNDMMRTLAFSAEVTKRQHVSPAIVAFYALSRLHRNAQQPGFDIPAWRKFAALDESGSIPVPLSWLKPIAEGFNDFCDEAGVRTLDEAFGAKATPNRKRAKAVVPRLLHHWILAQLIYQERLRAYERDDNFLVTEAIQRVLENLEGEMTSISEKTLQRAWGTWGKTLEMIDERQTRD